MCANEPHSFKNVRKCAATSPVYKQHLLVTPEQCTIFVINEGFIFSNVS